MTWHSLTRTSNFVLLHAVMIRPSRFFTCLFTHSGTWFSILINWINLSHSFLTPFINFRFGMLLLEQNNTPLKATRLQFTLSVPTTRKIFRHVRVLIAVIELNVLLIFHLLLFSIFMFLLCSTLLLQFIFSTALDGKIKAWLYDNLGSRVDYDAPGRWCTTMAYSADGTR